MTNSNELRDNRAYRNLTSSLQSSALASERDARILIVDDEPSLADLLMKTLTIAGFECQAAESKQTALKVANDMKPDLAILDVMLPDGTGFELCNQLKEKFPEIGVIFLTAKDTLENKLLGLHLGADDYITKPFSVAEVVARVNSVLRRSFQVEKTDNLIFEDLLMDLVAHKVARGGRDIELSPTEFKLLAYFMQNPGRVLSRQQLLLHVWEYDFVNDASIVEKFVSQLRKKIDQGAPKILHTVRSFGYVLRDQP